ncbi:roadblock/LC7 domain-containing protein [Candidatus Uabimicrobium sp. HlEnr_7]|uniref:roadblock/LC7 domain-containing protein n=1 Tax=Candidatus Uabimicrobium helgolandensis TaxID=3095367 RepID=UPI0035569F0B
MSDSQNLKLNRLIFYKEDVDLIDKVLQMFLKQCQAKCCILIDKEGHLITHHGETQAYELDTVCTLLAGTFAATREWARLLGEEEFSVLFHKGKKDSIQVNLVGDRTLLAVIFDDRTQLGLVKLISEKISKRLEKIFADSENRKESPDQEMVEGISKLGDAADELLDNIFGPD